MLRNCPATGMSHAGTERPLEQTDEQLQGDFAHLGKMRSSIRRVLETVRRGQRGYEGSLRLSARLERDFAHVGASQSAPPPAK
jgi:hypothetical protein